MGLFACGCGPLCVTRRWGGGPAGRNHHRVCRVLLMWWPGNKWDSLVRLKSMGKIVWWFVWINHTLVLLSPSAAAGRPQGGATQKCQSGAAAGDRGLTGGMCKREFESEWKITLNINSWIGMNANCFSCFRDVQGRKILQIFTLMKVLSHPGRGNSERCIVGKWTCLSFLRMFRFSSRRLLQF